jgi:hypothetical protein
MAGKKWEEQELLIIKENYASRSQKDFMELLPSRSYRSIECMANRLGLSKPSRVWSEEELNILKENYPISTPQEILSLLPERTNQTITHMANKLGILREDYRWTEAEDNVLRNHYDNKTVKDIMVMLPNRTDNGIKLRARVLGLWQDRSLPYRTYSHDYSFFSTPNVMNSYYGGLIASDGSVSVDNNTVRISLKVDDKKILEQFIRDIKYTGDLKYFEDKPGKNSAVKDKNTITPSVLVCLSGAGNVISDLAKNYNIVQNKTLVLKPPLGLGVEESLSFIVGLVDGDGWISLLTTKRKKVSVYLLLSIGVSGTFELLSWVKGIFDFILPNDSRPTAEVLKQKGTNIWSYKVGGKRAYRILKELQKVKTPTRLARKWDKISEYEKLVGIAT